MTETAGAARGDFAAELDDRLRLRQLFEGLRGRLDGREREAATLCYLQGLSRSEAAARMGVSDARMRKLMEGRGSGRPGVAGKVGALVASIRDGEWCEEQGSLMRALAYGILDPEGERYQLALMHTGSVPRAAPTSSRCVAWRRRCRRCCCRGGSRRRRSCAPARARIRAWSQSRQAVRAGAGTRRPAAPRPAPVGYRAPARRPEPVPGGGRCRR